MMRARQGRRWHRRGRISLRPAACGGRVGSAGFPLMHILQAPSIHAWPVPKLFALPQRKQHSHAPSTQTCHFCGCHTHRPPSRYPCPAVTWVTPPLPPAKGQTGHAPRLPAISVWALLLPPPLGAGAPPPVPPLFAIRPSPARAPRHAAARGAPAQCLDDPMSRQAAHCHSGCDRSSGLPVCRMQLPRPWVLRSAARSPRRVLCPQPAPPLL